MNTVRIVCVAVFFSFFAFQALLVTAQAEETQAEDVQMNAAQVNNEAWVGEDQMNEVKGVQSNESEMDQVLSNDIKAEVIPFVAKAVGGESADAESQGKILEAVKAVIKGRSKSTGSMDIYDSKIEKVRNLDLMNLQPTVAKDGDDQVVTGDFRDTKSGDVVTLEIKVGGVEGAYEIKDTAITNAQAPQAVKEEKKDYTDEEIQNFMKDYITIQAQTTGTFDLFDEKLGKMRNLEFVKLDEKVRRYGVIGISTAEFKDKNSGDTVLVDVNTENKNGLSVTAMRIKSTAKAAK